MLSSLPYIFLLFLFVSCHIFDFCLYLTSFCLVLFFTVLHFVFSIMAMSFLVLHFIFHGSLPSYLPSMSDICLHCMKFFLDIQSSFIACCFSLCISIDFLSLYLSTLPYISLVSFSYQSCYFLLLILFMRVESFLMFHHCFLM